MELTELKPCPFCGKIAHLCSDRQQGQGWQYFIACATCENRSKPFMGDMVYAVNSAKELWNRRANIGELTSPEYISRLRGVMGPEVANSIDHHQRLGRHADIIIEAINTYNGYMLDDDYNAQGTLDKIIRRMSERLAMDGTIASPVAGEVKG